MNQHNTCAARASETRHAQIACQARLDAEKAQQDLAAAREDLREYLPALAAEWAWKRNTTKSNNREMAELDAAIDAARAGGAE